MSAGARYSSDWLARLIATLRAGVQMGQSAVPRLIESADAALVGDCQRLMLLEHQANHTELGDTDDRVWNLVADERHAVFHRIEATPATTRAGLVWKARAAMAMVTYNEAGEIISSDLNQSLIDQVLASVAAETV